MGKSFFRRASFRLSDYAALAVGLFLGVQNAVWYFKDVRDFIDVQSIDVDPTPQGQPIAMVVLRRIERDFQGGYNVSLRDSEDGSLCTTGDIELPYSKNAALPDPLYLSYWAGGGSCQGRIPSQMQPGWYNIKTCHFVDTPWFVFVPMERCLDAPLEILPREDRE